jgi:carbonic anhydrase
MSVTDDLLENARAYGATFDKGGLPMPPGLHIAIVACMDARLNPYGLLGLAEGDAHVIRNAGGVITDDEIPVAGHQSAAARHPRDHPHPPHRLRHAHLHRR